MGRAARDPVARSIGSQEITTSFLSLGTTTLDERGFDQAFRERRSYPPR